MYSWQYAPGAIDLRIISVDFGDDEEYGGNGDSEGESSDQGVRSDIDMLESFCVESSF